MLTYCNSKLESAKVQPASTPELARVQPGSTVVVLDSTKQEEVTYKLVYEFSPDEHGHITNQATITSPIGKALLGKHIGETVTAQTPDGGILRLKILKLTPSELAPPSVAQVKHNLELLNYSGNTNDDSTIIAGQIRNNTAKLYKYVQVTFNLYDSQGNRVGTALANINGLEPGGVWKFKAVGMVKAQQFKLDEIAGF